MEDKFICKECGEKFNCPENLGKHVISHGLSNKEYYDRWLKKEGEGVCSICGTNTPFVHMGKGYRRYCSKKCSAIGVGIKNKKGFKIKREKIKESYEFECQECHEKFKTSTKLNNHITKIHGLKYYYDKWLKKEDEEICKICGKLTEFYNRIDLGYRKCCSKECAKKYQLNQRSKTNLIKYGVENVFQSKEIQQKIKDSCLEKYGVENNMQSELGRSEFKSSMNKKYGVDWPTQNKESLEKGQKSARKMKRFRNTDLWYQGTYELDFLERFYDKYRDIQRGPSLKYEHKGNSKIYHPDFYIPSLNLIIEIKSSWILKRDIEYSEKKKATISSGFKYLMILDKNYPLAIP